MRSLFVLCLFSLILVGCLGGSESSEVKTITELERTQGTYSPPAGGLLTQELVEEFCQVLEATRTRMADEGNGAVLEPSYNPTRDRNKSRIKGRKVSAALARTQAALGMVQAKYTWLKKTIGQARTLGKAGRSDVAAQNWTIVETYEQRLAELSAGLLH